MNVQGAIDGEGRETQALPPRRATQLPPPPPPCPSPRHSCCGLPVQVAPTPPLRLGCEQPRPGAPRLSQAPTCLTEEWGRLLPNGRRLIRQPLPTSGQLPTMPPVSSSTLVGSMARVATSRQAQVAVRAWAAAEPAAVVATPALSQLALVGHLSTLGQVSARGGHTLLHHSSEPGRPVDLSVSGEFGRHLTSIFGGDKDGSGRIGCGAKPGQLRNCTAAVASWSHQAEQVRLPGACTGRRRMGAMLGLPLGCGLGVCIIMGLDVWVCRC